MEIFKIIFYIKLKLFYSYSNSFSSCTIWIWFNKSGIIIFSVTPVMSEKNGKSNNRAFGTQDSKERKAAYLRNYYKISERPASTFRTDKRVEALFLFLFAYILMLLSSVFLYIQSSQRRIWVLRIVCQIH